MAERLFQSQLEVDAHNARVRLRQKQGLGEVVEVPALLEKDVKGPILQALLNHPRVAFAWRANSGKFKITDLYGTRRIVVNFVGCADLLFMTKSGRFGACEVKRDESEGARPAQQSFLDRVNQYGGLGFIARSVADVYAALENV